MTQHALSFGPLVLLGTQHGPFMRCEVRNDRAILGSIEMTVAEWTSLVALVDCMVAAEKRHAEDKAEIERLTALTMNPGATLHGSTITEIAKERDEYHEMLRAILAACDDSTRASIGKDAPLRAVRKVIADRDRLRSDLSAALVSVDAMAERIEQMRPVYERVVDWHRVRVPGMQQHDKFVSTEDALWDAIDTALARTAREQAKVEK